MTRKQLRWHGAAVLALASLLVAGTASAAIPAAERNALVALYNGANGASWTNKTNWLGADGTECSWFGVTCSGDGSAVTRLSLASNNLSGAIPTEIGSLPSLTHLWLQYNNLAGTIPASLGSLASLQYLYLNDNQLSGAIPSELGNLTNLLELVLRYNQLSGTIPVALGGLVNLQRLELNENYGLGGAIPAELGGLANLRFLYLSGNQLSGAIPAELGALSNLVSLSLDYNNHLSGSIPAELGALSKLEYLELTCNDLSGSIPATFGNLTSLLGLGLGCNRLTGTIPPELGALTTLQSLRLDGNQLRGPLPATLANLTSLVAGTWQVDLRWNALYSTDADLTTFLNGKQAGGDWQSTQTVAPTGVSAAGTGPYTATVSWTPIAYTGNTGGYRVLVSATSGSGYSLLRTTANKSAGSATLSGLAPAATHYVVVESFTNSHLNNKNAVTSERTAEVSLTTSVPPAPTVAAFDPQSGPVGTGVTVTGTSFVGATAVAFSGTGASSFTVASSTSITVEVPAGAGSGPISVTTAGGTGTSGASFTVTAASAGFHTVTPCRLFDSRDPALGGPSPLAAGTSTSVAVAGNCGVPVTASAVSVNVTATQATAPGHLRLYPAGGAVPTASTVNFAPSLNRANNAVVPLGTGGQIDAYSGQQSGSVHFIVDVNGYFE